MTVGAILLAAGGSRRMGADKLLVDLGGKALGLHALDAIATAGIADPLIAVAPGRRAAALFAGRGRIVEVVDHERGQGHSIAAAMRAVPDDWTAVVICLADMPFVTPATLRALADAASPGVVIRPHLGGQPGNPLVWGRDHFPALARSKGDVGGRAIIAALTVTALNCDDPGILIDVDTPEALKQARERLQRP